MDKVFLYSAMGVMSADRFRLNSRRLVIASLQANINYVYIVMAGYTVTVSIFPEVGSSYQHGYRGIRDESI